MAGFRIYHNNNIACETYDPQARQLDCEVFVESYPATFTATAYDKAGNESTPSPPAPLDPPLNEPPQAIFQAVSDAGSSITTQPGANEIVLDNGGSSTSATGTWKDSGGVNPYGSGSAYSNEPGATYTFQTAASGTAEVSMWWTEYSNRETAVPVKIYDGNTLLDTVTVNQQGNGGKWNLLGTYSFTGTARVVLVSGNDTNTTTCADAVRLASSETLEEEAPLTIDFDAAGSTDPDGAITGYDWDFGDGQTASGEFVSHTFTTAGTYTVTLTVTDDQHSTSLARSTIIATEAPAPPPNEPPMASISATPLEGQAPLAVAFDGLDSVDPDGTIVGYSWDFGDGQSGQGETIDHIYTAPGAYTVTLSTTDNAGDTDQTQVTLSVSENTSTAAGFAFNFQPADAPVPEGYVIDSGAAFNEITGFGWTESPGTLGARDRNSSYSPDQTYDTMVHVDPAGIWELAVPNGEYVVTVCAGDPANPDSLQSVQAEGFSVLNGEQLTTANRWLERQSQVLVQDGRLTLTFEGSSPYAKMAWLRIEHANEAPNAVIAASALSGTAPLAVNFSGENSTDADGSIAGYSWNFGDGTTGKGMVIDHTYSTAGAYEATLTVKDNKGTTGTARMTISVAAPAPTPAEIIVDNGGSGTSFTGTWLKSGGPNPYGNGSVYSNRSGATYTYEAAVSGTTEVSMWWTEFSNRETAVPVKIYDGNTLLATVTVNQQANGGKWNVLGTYSFAGKARVVIASNSSSSTTTCADAVKFAAGSGGTTPPKTNPEPPAQPVEVIVDNGGAGATFTGTWLKSGGPNPYGNGSVYSNQSGATYTYEAAVSGTTEVSMWWTEFSNRETAVPVKIYDGNTLLATVTVNQKANGGKWNVLGTYSFTGKARVVIASGSSTGTTTCADAVRLVSN